MWLINGGQSKARGKDMLMIINTQKQTKAIAVSIRKVMEIESTPLGG